MKHSKSLRPYNKSVAKPSKPVEWSLNLIKINGKRLSFIIKFSFTQIRASEIAL
jgi:hypothetical protein